MKRLYVSDRCKGLGIGRRLVDALMVDATAKGYRTMRLDTLPWMTAAQQMYRSLGFYEIAAYVHNPIAGTVFMEKVLQA